ncbi:tyrosine-type recombinase/integrase [Thalassotalea marina]|uniref:Integrase n=1 Tax=Thalassotalea marina TaxID=1673741 RepID=A0A919ENL0_9GAMM|nr:site-specific integrase [Thalassotalea marina]GHG07011.1 integrase [Thalassotalea marina]
MYIIKSTSEFKVKGIPLPNFPLLTWNYSNDLYDAVEGDIFKEGLKYLLYKCIKRGRVSSESSWITYANHLCHFFSFCEDNELDWRDIAETNEDEMLLALYRDISIEEFNLSYRTVNQRLRTVIDFYKRAYFHDWIKSLPYSLELVRTKKYNQSFLAHTDRAGGERASYDVLAKEKPRMIKLLSIVEVRYLLDAIQNPTLKLMVRLCLQTGIRKEELFEFPLCLIKKPLQGKVSYRVELTKTKGNRGRSIDIPGKLMKDLWRYVNEIRYQQSLISGIDSKLLFLNDRGVEWNIKTGSFNKALNNLNLPFKVYPHKLRHTYATHTLAALLSRKTNTFNPLIYLRDRLGHSSINTTMIYVHLVNELMDDLTHQYQDEINNIV